MNTVFLLFLRLSICIGAGALMLYIYIAKQNNITRIRLEIPSLAKEVRELQEENLRLKYEIEQWESPIHLMELARQPEFGHLKYPYQRDIIILPQP